MSWVAIWLVSWLLKYFRAKIISSLRIFPLSSLPLLVEDVISSGWLFSSAVSHFFPLKDTRCVSNSSFDFWVFTSLAVVSKGLFGKRLSVFAPRLSLISSSIFSQLGEGILRCVFWCFLVWFSDEGLEKLLVNSVSLILGLKTV